MRNPARIDIVLKVIGECWKKVPDWRFGQLMCNLQKKAGNDLFYMEDEDFMDFVDEVKKEFENS